MTYHYIGKRYDYDYDNSRTVNMGGLSLWDVGLSYPVTSHLTVRGKIANLFDKDCEQFMATNLQDGNTPCLAATPSDPRPTVLVFDSGVGGLSVYNEIRQLLPKICIIYAFDNVAFPYGEKSEEFIVERVVEIVTAVQQRYPLALAVIACNTASTVSLPALREKFAFPVVGVVPAIKPAARLTANGIVGLLATRYRKASLYP